MFIYRKQALPSYLYNNNNRYYWFVDWVKRKYIYRLFRRPNLTVFVYFYKHFKRGVGTETGWSGPPGDFFGVDSEMKLLTSEQHMSYCFTNIIIISFFVKWFQSNTVSFFNVNPLPDHTGNKWFNGCGGSFMVVTCSSNSAPIEE